VTATDVFTVQASFAQQRMWLLEQLEDGGPAYNSQLGLRFHGPLDVAAVDYAVAELARRHEILRTTFHDQDGELWQAIGEPPDDLVEFVDLTGEPTDALARATDDELRRTFDLATGPVLRVKLFRLHANEHVLLLTLDHLTCDGWSMGILHRELTRLYAGDSPAEPAIGYVDFAQWQRDWLRGAELERQLSYWRKALADPPPLISFPPGSGPTVGKSVQPLPRGLEDRLAELGRRHNASLFVVLTAAFGALFSRSSGQPDVVLGSVVANRGQAELDDVVGLFTNTVALRLDHSADPTLGSLIDRARGTVLDMHANQHVPFDRVVEELAPDRPGRRSPFFNVIIEFADVERSSAEVGPVRIEPMPIGTLPIPVDLIVAVRRDAGELAAVWQYDSETLSEGAVALLREQFLGVLGTMVDAPDTRLADLRITAAESTVDEVHGQPAGAADPELVGVIIEVWEEVLGRSGITPRDGFFELGGNSLAATRVISRLRRKLTGNLRIRLLFEHPRPSDFAAALTQLGVVVA
jgi:hypothetical protein